MPATQVIKNLPFMNVAASSVATLQLPLGPTYERIVLKLGGTTFTKAHLTNIKCKINGKTFHEFSGSDLDKINSYSGMFADAAFLTIDFTELFARDEIDQSLGAVATAQGVANFTIECNIGAATAPTLESWSEISAPRITKDGSIPPVNKLVKFSQNFAVAGKFNFQLPYGLSGGTVIKRVYIMAANITDLEIKKNGLVIFDASKAVNEFMQKEHKKTPQASMFVFDPIWDDNASGMLLTTDAASMEWNMTLSGAETVNVYLECIDPLGNL